jgi:hypothetical protein
LVLNLSVLFESVQYTNIKLRPKQHFSRHQRLKMKISCSTVFTKQNIGSQTGIRPVMVFINLLEWLTNLKFILQYFK